MYGVITLGKPRFNSNYEFELIRMAFRNGVNIVGGAEKLWKHFIEDNKPMSVISYCNISKFSGAVYGRLGFKFDGVTTPNYVWVHPSKNEVLSRYKTTKSKLVSLKLGTNEDTEDSIMESMCYLKIYDCGNAKYIWTPNS